MTKSHSELGSQCVLGYPCWAAEHHTEPAHSPSQWEGPGNQDKKKIHGLT